MVTVTSELPMGSGLGSSAALCVALSTALLAAAGRLDDQSGQPGEDCGSWRQLRSTDAAQVNAWAIQGERLFHGNPSGIDNSVSTFGGFLSYKGGRVTALAEPAAGLPPLQILLADTCVARSTGAQVSFVAQRTARHPAVMTCIFNAVDAVATEAAGLLLPPQRDNSGSDSKAVLEPEAEERLVELININQGLLQSMGVSHPAVDHIVTLCASHDLAAKLTGAGGGGCVLALLPSSEHSLMLLPVPAPE
eukprot:SM000010S04375  [mRNA]  locus=s10:1269794:1270826:+ [translate_table: standard]